MPPTQIRKNEPGEDLPQSNLSDAPRNWLLRRVQRLGLLAGAGYLSILGFLMWNETSLVYPGRDVTWGDWNPTNVAIESVEFTSADGNPLHAWLLPQPESRRYVVVFHGNAENVATTTAGYGRKLHQVLEANVLIFDYRGYGRSPGVPFEPKVVEDGVAAVRWMAQRFQIDPEDMLFYGSSLGGGVAVAVAERTGARMLLLDRTFGAITEPASAAYPWIPVRWLMRNQFPSVQRIQSFSGPVFISHFSRDELIPIASSRRLFDAAPTADKQFHEMPGGHHLAELPPSYWEVLKAFVDIHEGIVVEEK